MRDNALLTPMPYSLLWMCVNSERERVNAPLTTAEAVGMLDTRKIEIGSRLRECREGAKLSLSDVAEELRVSKQAVAHWEGGTRRLDAERLGDLALLYGVSADYILFGTHMVPEDLKELFARVAR
jgi:DNA-binding transcriptional regulator YiaG